MYKLIVFALVIGLCQSSPVPRPLTSGIPGALTTTHHHTSTAAHHHPVGLGMYGLGTGLGTSLGSYPGVVKHTETVSSAGYPATAALNPYGAYSAYPGIAGLGYGGSYLSYPAAKQITQVTTTAVRPSMYGYF